MDTAVPAVDTGVADEFVTLNGLRFHYRDWGNVSAQALVCLHGLGGHARMWDAFARAVRDRYRVLALDQRGHGETEWATDYHPDRRVEDVEAFVAALGLDHFALLGHSLGGGTAFMYAARHPAKVERLVIVDCAPSADPVGMQRVRRNVESDDLFETPEDAFAARRAANRRPPDDVLRDWVRHNLVQRPDGTWTWRFDVALRNGSGALVRPTPEEQARMWESLRNITAPTLLLRGAESDLLSPALAQRMVETVPNCRVVEVPGAGHSVPYDNPSGFLAAVQTFL